MYNFESDSSLIIYVSRRNRQTTPRVLFLTILPVRSERAAAEARRRR